MESKPNVLQLIERIASALERIAAKLEQTELGRTATALEQIVAKLEQTELGYPPIQVGDPIGNSVASSPHELSISNELPMGNSGASSPHELSISNELPMGNSGASSPHELSISNELLDPKDVDPSEGEEGTIENNGVHRIIEFLNRHQISVKVLPPEEIIDESLDKISLFMGNKYASIARVHELIKRYMNEGKPFSLSIKGESPQKVADITQFCTQMYNLAFFTEYKYMRSPQFHLYITPNRDPRILNFFSGQWLERYIRMKIISVLKLRSLSFAYISNPQVTLPNGEDFEFDVFFEVEGQIYWLEAKTADYRKHIGKYSKISKMLGIDRSRAFIVLADLDMTDETARDLSNLFGMRVVKIERLADELEEAFPMAKSSGM